MAVSSLSMSLASSTLPKKLNVPNNQSSSTRVTAFLPQNSRDITHDEENCKRRPILLGVGALGLSLFPASPLFAEEIPQNYTAFVDVEDGFSYYYPSDWRDFDFRGHDSAFKDRYLQLQNVRLSFIPTVKKDAHDLGPMEEVVSHLVKHVYSAPIQMPTVFDMQERTIDGKNYYTFEYVLTSPHFSRAAFATIAVGNGRYYTLIVGANERRWRRVRNQLKVVADSFRLLDI
ncbi:photosynthetic NDH subunit of lumenal location 1, chloroplastic-like isoform X1 [Actinidia eriantha]|uniref:photosynthetic NDH subunit of lumenal location 1, chloroplastic-like isoform X1 n=1 Tax=Actinidia eriantha TaxID=165200 RepID=UPI002589B4E0|nr:photosynthetic NDH subunit of lumenal location 1, chloroplastic-like isoform X1 [Actinidia eriantha]